MVEVGCVFQAARYMGRGWNRGDVHVYRHNMENDKGFIRS